MDLQLEQEYINSVVHEKKLILFATDSDGRIYYTVKQQGYEDGYERRRGWEYWRYLPLPAEENGVQGQVKTIPDSSVEKKEAETLTYKKDRHTFYFCRSRYSTWDETAIAPVQLVSAMGYLYVFRQSRGNANKTGSNTLLVDRFMLDKMRNRLVRKLEVRFKRSRQKHRLNEQETSLPDSLDFRDMEQSPFYEPTIELSMVENLHKGWFCVIFVPTVDRERSRWHIFAYNYKKQKVEVFSFWASPETPFDFNDQPFLMSAQGEDDFFPLQKYSAIIQRTLDLGEARVTHGLTATSYHVQSEEKIAGKNYFLKKDRRVMLFIPTDKSNHTAAISFAVGREGNLSQIEESIESCSPLCCKEESLHIPSDALERIQFIASKKLREAIASKAHTVKSHVKEGPRSALDCKAVRNDEGVILNRKNAEGECIADVFINKAILPVIPGEVYEETFLFKVDAGIELSELSKKDFFSFDLWGKGDDENAKFVPIKTKQESFSLFGRGVWLRASCQFTIPQELYFIRTFGISSFYQDWDTLTIREHCIVHLSGAVTKETYTDKIKLSVLSNPEEELMERLKMFAAQEKQETLLIERKRQLKEYIARIEDLQMTRRAVSEMTGEINHLKEKNRQLFKSYDKARKNVLNYWFKLTLKDKQYTEYMLHVDPFSRKVRYAAVQIGVGMHPCCRFSLEPVGEDYYRLICGYEGLALCIDKEGRVKTSMDRSPLQDGCLWKFEMGRDNGYLIRNKIDDRVLVLNKEGGDDVTTIKSGETHSNLWKVEKAVLQSSNNLIDQARYRFIKNANLLRFKNKEQEQLQHCMVSDKEDNFRLQAELYENAKEISKLQIEQDKARVTFLEGIQSISYKRQSMPLLYRDKRDLATYGAWLGFINANSHISVIESCEGEVVLHYFDEKGCLSDARCSVISPVGKTFCEDWLPHEPPVCFKFNEKEDKVNAGPAIDLARISFTIEFWAKRDSDTRWNVILGQGINSPGEGLYIGFNDDAFTFSFISDDLHTTEEEDFDWHHWACVYDSTTRRRLIYRDGILAAEDTAKKDYQGKGDFMIGYSYAREKNFYGKLAEFSIWEKALSAEEVMLHSKVNLRGDESGLLVYYRMNEMVNEQINDGSSNHIHGKTKGVKLCPRTAPIGHLQSYAMCFDGENDFLTLSDLDEDFSNGITLETWVYLNNCDDTMPIIDLGRGMAEDNILFLAYEKDIKGPAFHLYQGDSEENVCTLSAQEPLEQNQWIHLALTIDDDGNGRLYKNGEKVANGKMPLPVSILRTRNYIGKSNWKKHVLLNGKLSELRLWISARSQQQIQQTMRLRLTKDQQDLAGYWPMSDFAHSVDSIVPDMANKCDAVAQSAVFRTDMHLPIGSKAVSVMEYPMEYLDTNRSEKTVLIDRHFAYTHRNNVTVLVDQPIGQIEREWIGHKNFAPIFLGYIEPPPSMSNNGTESYKQANTVMLRCATTESDNTSRDQRAPTGFISAGSDSDQGELQENFSTSCFMPENQGHAAIATGQADIFVYRLKKQKTVFDYEVRLAEGTAVTVKMIPFQRNTSESKVKNRVSNGYCSMDEAKLLEQSIYLQEKEREAYYFNLNGIYYNTDAAEDSTIENSVLMLSLKTAQQKYTCRRNLVHTYLDETSKKKSALAGLVDWYENIKNTYKYASRHNIVNHYTWSENYGLSVNSQSVADTITYDCVTNFSLFDDDQKDIEAKVVSPVSALTAWQCIPMQLSLDKGGDISRKVWQLDITTPFAENENKMFFNLNEGSDAAEQVSGYDFASFFLENKIGHFYDFFSVVVDPLWIKDNDVHGSLLRKIAQAGTPTKTWRILHYFTSVKNRNLTVQNDYQKDSNKKSSDNTSSFDTEKMMRFIRETQYGIEKQVKQLSDAYRNHSSMPSLQANPSFQSEKFIEHLKRLEHRQISLEEQLYKLSETIQKKKSRYL